MKVIEKIPQKLLDATNEFAKNLEWSRRLPIYEIHKWWARRYSGIVKLFLIYSYLDYNKLNGVKDFNKFVSKLYWDPPKVDGKTLLDPFCGGGTIILEASKLGFESYGIEINKLAYLILDSYKKLNKLDLHKLKKGIVNFAEEINKDLWGTKCKRDHDAIIIHTFLAWKDNKGNLQIRTNKIKDLDGDKCVYYCVKCEQIFEEKSDISYCPFCGTDLYKQHNRQKEYCELHPYALEYYCPICGVREIKKVDKQDIENFFNHNFKTTRAEIQTVTKIPSLNETNRLIKNGIRYFDELLTPRQKITFYEFLKRFRKTPYEKISKLMVSDSLRSCSLLAYYSPKYKKVIPGFVIKSYWLPIQPVELNPVSFIDNGFLKPLGRGNLISSYKKIFKALKNDHGYVNNYKVYLGASQDILKKLRKKFDIVFTDPPYADYQYYSDLSLFNLSLLQELNKEYMDYLLDKEIVLREKSEIEDYISKLLEVFALIKKRLSTNGKLIITFHHHDVKVIKEFVSVFKQLRLNLDAVYPVLGESSGKLSTRKLYLDLLFVFSKRKRDTYFVPTNIYLTKEDEKLIQFIDEIVEDYNNDSQ